MEQGIPGGGQIGEIGLRPANSVITGQGAVTSVTTGRHSIVKRIVIRSSVREECPYFQNIGSNAWMQIRQWHTFRCISRRKRLQLQPVGAVNTVPKQPYTNLLQRYGTSIADHHAQRHGISACNCRLRQKNRHRKGICYLCPDLVVGPFGGQRH